MLLQGAGLPTLSCAMPLLLAQRRIKSSLATTLLAEAVLLLTLPTATLSVRTWPSGAVLLLHTPFGATPATTLLSFTTDRAVPLLLAQPRTMFSPATALLPLRLSGAKLRTNGIELAARGGLRRLRLSVTMMLEVLLPKAGKEPRLTSTVGVAL